MNIEHLLLGFAIGDAFGAGVEFQDKRWIEAHVDFTKFINVRHAIKVPDSALAAFTEHYTAWDYTDDTEMTLGLIKALLSSETFNEDVLIEYWKKEYDQGVQQKGYGRNGHGSMRWYYSGEKSISEIRSFQKNRPNPGNAPAMRAIPLGLLSENLITTYAKINAEATHPNINAILSSQCIARAAEYIVVKEGNANQIITYCIENVDCNDEYLAYLKAVDELAYEERLSTQTLEVLCGPQPIQRPYFLPGIYGMPSDSKYTTGCVLYILKYHIDAFETLKYAVRIGGDIDSVASITTGIIAGRYGIDSLPSFMLDNVEGIAYLKTIAHDFTLFLKQYDEY